MNDASNVREAPPVRSLESGDIKPFIGSRDFEESRDFYVALGWKLNWENPNLAELELDDCRLYLQRYYERKWCENSMLHITVADATAWYEHVKRVLDARSYGAARVKPPQRQDYGALVTHVWDPVGILLHFAQRLDV